MTPAEWKEIVAGLVVYFPSARIDREAIEAWYTDLEDLPTAHVEAAVRALLRDGREFPPNGGQIRVKAVELTNAPVDHGAAWSLAMTAVRRFGSYQGAEARAWIAEQDEATAVAVDRFGWLDLCLFNVDDLPTVRAQFREIYRGVTDRGLREQRYTGITGIEPKRLGPRPLGEIAREAVDG